MKKYLPASWPGYLMLVIILGSIKLPAAGQVYAKAALSPPQLHEEISKTQGSGNKSVRSILFELEESYHVSFNYDDAIMQGLTLKEEFSWSKNENLETVLKRLTSSAQLTYEKVDDSNYLILSPRKKESKKEKVKNSTASAEPTTEKMEVNIKPAELPEQITNSIAFRVTGIVRDETSTALPGVNVIVKGTTIGTTTDGDGRYILDANEGSDILVFSFIGYKTEEIPIGNRTIIDMTLLPDVQTLNEVVVVGYGEQKKGNVLGSVAEVKVEEIQDFPVASLANILVNKAPGVSVSTASGKPGAYTKISIRNPVPFAQIGGDPTDPLFVVDGFIVPRENFDALDATQVESITFLKDAAATIYGAQGANGVVLVTTKRGKPGKAKISYTGSYAISEATKFSDVLNGYEYAKYLNDYWATKNVQEPINPFTGYLYSDDELEYLKTHRFNWLGDTWQNSHLQRHTITVSGGNEKVTYFGGGSFYDETGNLRDLYIKKYNIRFGIDAKITDHLNFNVTLSADNSITNRPAPKGITDQSETLSGTIGALMLTPGWIPMYIDDKAVYNSNINWHPYELQNSGSYAKNESQGATLNAALEYKVPKIEGLSIKMQYALSRRNDFGKEYYASYDTYDFVRQGTHNSNVPNVIFTNDVLSVKSIKNGNFLSESFNSVWQYQFNQFINYQRTFGEHEVKVMLAAEEKENFGDSFKSTREGQDIPTLDQLFAYTTDRSKWDTYGSGVEGSRLAYFGRVNYAYKNRYLLEGIFRADAAPNFPPETQWGYFPSVAVGWKISEENFFHVTWVDNLKIRFQVGLTGNNTTQDKFPWKIRYTPTTGALYGTTFTNGLNDSAIPNPNISWEKSLYRNVGIDGTIFNGRFNFTLDFYHRHEYDKFDSPTNTVPTTFGAVIQPINYGILNSWGFEGGLQYNGSVNEFKYSVGVNMGTTDNKVIRRYVQKSYEGTWRDPNGRRTDEGIEAYQQIGIVRSQEELDAFLAEHPGYKISGKEPQIGWMLFKDINDDGVVDGNDKVRVIDRANPRFGLGFNLGASYKGFRLSANISYSIGGYHVYEKGARTPPDLKGKATGLALWNDAWSVNNIDGKYPFPGANLVNDVYDLWIVKGSTMTVNNMSLSYSLPNDLSTKYGIPALKVFITGTNLWDIINPLPYKYSGTNLSTDYPALRTFTLGLNLQL